ncbi:cytochrome ubiquinol oxidase subunit I [Lamprobacter modestohalophilus]|uniref:cytochrome ubiquinol oxidase subunit I n=1 Tax=Lamprobacter modestohalophilus TaxID=1064514 RepID=UPI002ADEF2AF|nr:cytochrome ubiquinol oxidase subunit I [Lamprobacter modestohalophilus]MEA1049136.1 cytochrome ubiquinol oxidase subunit I [Lamprobacter modestohalophilus]
MDLDPLLISRLQFAFTVSFHIIFPAFTIGLAAWLATLEGMSLVTGRPVYRRLFDFWLKVFAVAFGLGVVSGLVMAFQFGTNWGELSTRAGPIQGPLLAYESFTAFLLEATFFGVLLFGRGRVPGWAYFLSTLMVALGTTFSAFWIMANNSWMQVPVGYELVDGIFTPRDWAEILLDPVLWVRFPHMLLGAYLTTAFCVAATGAWYLLRHRHLGEARVMLAMGLGIAAVLIPVQIAFGHLNGEYTAAHQLSKFTTIEGRWQTEQPARLLLFAWPDIAAERNRFEIAVPYLGSFVDQGNFTAEEPGIVTVPAEDRPPFLIPFYGFRIMVGLGLVMLAISWVGLWLTLRGRFRRPRPGPRWFLWATFLAWPSGFIAVLTGWLTAEVGRQPWVVFDVMRTAEAVTPSLSSGAALTSLVAYLSVYALIFSAGTLYLYRLLRAGPLEDGPESAGGPSGGARPAGPGDLNPGRPLAVGGPAPAAERQATQTAAAPTTGPAQALLGPSLDGGAA